MSLRSSLPKRSPPLLLVPSQLNYLIHLIYLSTYFLWFNKIPHANLAVRQANPQLIAGPNLNSKDVCSDQIDQDLDLTPESMYRRKSYTRPQATNFVSWSSGAVKKSAATARSSNTKMTSSSWTWVSNSLRKTCPA